VQKTKRKVEDDILVDDEEESLNLFPNEMIRFVENGTKKTRKVVVAEQIDFRVKVTEYQNESKNAPSGSQVSKFKNSDDAKSRMEEIIKMMIRLDYSLIQRTPLDADGQPPLDGAKNNVSFFFLRLLTL
jgi:hypothetical protein